MRIFNSEASLRVNGNYGTTPDMASIWFASAGSSVGGYTQGDFAYVNLSSSIPATFIGFDLRTQQQATSNNNSFRHVGAIAAYGVNAGGTSLSANNQMYEWYLYAEQGNSSTQLGITFDGTNRRFRFYFASTDYAMTGYCYIRVVCRYISYVTISY